MNKEHLVCWSCLILGYFMILVGNMRSNGFDFNNVSEVNHKEGNLKITMLVPGHWYEYTSFREMYISAWNMRYDMIWFGMIWYDIIWYDIWYMIYDVIWCDVMWCGVVWCGVMWCDVMWYMIWYDMIWYDMIWYDMIWYEYASWPEFIPNYNGIIII